MRLRTKLALSFAALALLPMALLGWAALATVTATFDGVFQRRLADAEHTVRLEVTRTGHAVATTVAALATTAPQVARLARRLRQGPVPPGELVPLAGRLRVGRDLDVLFLLDAKGQVLSSAHLPARFGDTEPDLLDLAAHHPGEAVLRRVEVRQGGRLAEGLALIAGRAAAGPGATPDLYLVGGRLLGEGRLGRLAAVTGASVRLLAPGGEVLASSGPAVRGVARRVPLLGADGRPVARLEATVSRAPLDRARRRILLGLGVAGTLALAAALILGGLLATRITRPVDALAAAAGRLGAGDDTARVDARAGGEVGALITAFNGMADELRLGRQRLATAERVAAWREIARRLAHEIKNPLMPISTSIETLRRARAKQHPQFDEIFDESSQAILEEVSALKRIVDEFSRFARLPAPQLERLAPGSLVAGAAALFPEPRGITLETGVADRLPEILADREQLQQVLLNLVTNAVQAIEGASGQGRVTVTARLAGDAVALEVADDGPGIPEENLGELFTPYFTTKEEGTGLGLAICHRIVSEHRGRIEVESHAGQGTRFTVVLPAA